MNQIMMVISLNAGRLYLCSLSLIGQTPADASLGSCQLHPKVIAESRGIGMSRDCTAQSHLERKATQVDRTEELRDLSSVFGPVAKS
jgi:hypothetical protein